MILYYWFEIFITSTKFGLIIWWVVGGGGGGGVITFWNIKGHLYSTFLLFKVL